MTQKNKKKLEAKKQRVWFDMNLGTITHKDNKHLSRQARKMRDRKEFNE